MSTTAVNHLPLLLDGAMGTTLLKLGYSPPFEELNITHPQLMRKIHQEFIDAGAQIILTHTFAAQTQAQVEAAWINILDLPVIKFASIGPMANTQLMVDFFKDKARLVFETIYSVEAARELITRYHHLDPIFSFCLRPADFKIILPELQDFKLTTIGLNCLDGLSQAQELLSLIPAHYELYFKPNTGSSTLSPQDFSRQLTQLLELFPITYLGGCCGTTVAHLQEIQKVQKVRRTF